MNEWFECKGIIDLSVISLYCPEVRQNQGDIYPYYDITDKSTVFILHKPDNSKKWKYIININGFRYTDYILNAQVNTKYIIGLMASYKYAEAVEYERHRKIDTLFTN